MKTLISIMAMMVVFSGAIAQNDKSDAKSTDSEEKTLSVTWKSTVHDFEEVPIGKPVTAHFEFTNDGVDPITISKVRSSCGCTVADYSKEPIMPGKTGQVSATYNAEKKGNFSKSVTVYINQNNTYRLNVKGIVKEKN